MENSGVVKSIGKLNYTDKGEDDMSRCECLVEMARVSQEDIGEHHHRMCLKYKTEKFPQLFYEEDGLNAWVPVPDNIDNIIVVEDQMEESEIVEIRFKRFDMTDEEMDALPEG